MKHLLPDFGDLFTIADFRQCVDIGLFIDEDGSGYYSDGVLYGDKDVAKPSEIGNGIINPSATHVIWFNK